MQCLVLISEDVEVGGEGFDFFSQAIDSSEGVLELLIQRCHSRW